MIRRPPRSTLFPTRRSSDLFESTFSRRNFLMGAAAFSAVANVPKAFGQQSTGAPRDRKSTRLNSSHQIISYAVFCLKKKKAGQRRTPVRNQVAVNHHNDDQD